MTDVYLNYPLREYDLSQGFTLDVHDQPHLVQDGPFFVSAVLEIYNNAPIKEDVIFNWHQESLPVESQTGTYVVFQTASLNVRLETYSGPNDEAVNTQFALPFNSTMTVTNAFNDASSQTSMSFRVAANSTLIYEPATTFDETAAGPSISYFHTNGTIKVPGATGAEYVDGALVYKNASGDIIAKFNTPEESKSFIPEKLEFDGDSITYTCYLKGTHIATPDGEVKVEDLKAGDKVRTATGGVNTVKWIGFRKVNRLKLPAELALRVSPIRICKGAFADNVPHRDLTVSPGHRFDFDGALVPAFSLVNGVSIVQDFGIQLFDYYHVELEKFDMLLAEGATAESYLEVGDNRNSFQNAKTVTAKPGFEPAHGRVFLSEYVQKITPDIIEPIRRELFKRAELLTGAFRTADSDLHIEINGQVIRPQTPCKKKGLYRFELPAGLSGEVSILSNAAVVRETSLIDRTDTRTIGVGLSGMAFVIGGERREIDLNDTWLTGFNKVQEMDGVPMRWTTGKAVIPANFIPTSFTSSVLELDVLRTHMYWDLAEKVNIRRVA